MLQEEIVIGNYAKQLGFEDNARRQILILLEDLNSRKGYQDETLFVAANIVDRYLHTLIC